MTDNYHSPFEMMVATEALDGDPERAKRVLDYLPRFGFPDWSEFSKQEFYRFFHRAETCMYSDAMKEQP